MLKAWLIFVAFLGLVCNICEARGVNLGLCEDTHYSCSCGKSHVPVLLRVKECSFAHRWKVKCKPCDNLKPEDLCPRYTLCQQCHADGGDSCLSCPEGKFGTWCENDCTCLNGGTCDRHGQCVCLKGFEGRNCEDTRGCPLPENILDPLEAVITPPENPMTTVYSCPQGYELKGQAVSTCLSNKKWSSRPPVCLLKCPLLSAPANGRMTFSGNELVEGVTAEVSCNRNYRLIGERTLTCSRGGNWNAELPTCEAVASCPDPEEVPNALRTIKDANRLGAYFVQDSVIKYTCNAGFEQMGVDRILCKSDGSWSSELPTCVSVSTVIPDCNTPGSDVISQIGVPVRIVCPPECTDQTFQVWGTSIYRAGSSVCQAAIHSAKITNSGGAVEVINNGPYSHFTGSHSNNVESKSYPDRDASFRFDRVARLSKSRDARDCERGLLKLDQTCAYISNALRTKKEAEAVCTNLGLEMEIPSNNDDKISLITNLNAKGINSVWSGTDTEIPEYENNPSELTQSGDQCNAVTVENLDFKSESRHCDQILNYVCLRKSGAGNLATCDDPGQLANGKAEPIGQIDGVYYVGSSIEFACQPLHYLKGAQTISCTTNGNWSNQKPVCIKVNACEDPPVPFGGFLTYLPPLKSASAQRSAVHTSRIAATRLARLPAGLAAPAPENMPLPATTSEPESVSLPPGFHRLGTRAMYDCESRYYKLIGSRTRRCQDQGEWSGRPPTCIPICGRSDSPRSPFVVNGNATDIGQWPWQAGIARYLPDYNRWFLLCGASLINERWIISAAHCVTYAGTILTIEPDKFQVYLGKYHRSDSKDDEYVQVRKIQEIHIHPDYDPGLFDADVALIQLDSPVQLNSRVQPVCLPTEQSTRENLVEGKKGVVTGWGMNENETYSETLQQAVLPVVSSAICEKGYEESDLPLTVTDNMFCAGYAKGRTDACSGDSGGPMVFTDDSSKERKWVLEGIVSWGSPQGCGNPNQYGGFTTVSRFLDWIHLYF